MFFSQKVYVKAARMDMSKHEKFNTPTGRFSADCIIESRFLGIPFSRQPAKAIIPADPLNCNFPVYLDGVELDFDRPIRTVLVNTRFDVQGELVILYLDHKKWSHFKVFLNDSPCGLL